MKFFFNNNLNSCYSKLWCEFHHYIMSHSFLWLGVFSYKQKKYRNGDKKVDRIFKCMLQKYSFEKKKLSKWDNMLSHFGLAIMPNIMMSST